MEHTTRLVLATTAAVIFCAYVTVAVPAARVARVQGDLTQLANLIHRLKHLDTADSDDDDAWAALSRKNEDPSSHSTGSADSPPADKLAALRQGFLGFNKRQGTWSYDYGLGGGRFGKRYYGDYGIGGGRFGRDVDHVDIAESSDVTL
ncbi:hypothetical protein ACOMHN_009941 [Nucella lapillus]